MKKFEFDYFRANEQEQYLFVQFPTILIKDEKFKGLSDSAKILYSLLLNRTALSIKNNWLDEKGNVYIIYTVDEIMQDLNCWEQKAHKELKALKEIGLIQTMRRGLNKPNLIYVMNFASELKYSKNKKADEKPDTTGKCENHISGKAEITNQEIPKSQIKRFQNHKQVISISVRTTIIILIYQSYRRVQKYLKIIRCRLLILIR